MQVPATNSLSSQPLGRCCETHQTPWENLAGLQAPNAGNRAVPLPCLELTETNTPQLGTMNDGRNVSQRNTLQPRLYKALTTLKPSL